MHMQTTRRSLVKCGACRMALGPAHWQAHGMAELTIGIWILVMWAMQAAAVFAIVYAAARLAIRHERR